MSGIRVFSPITTNIVASFAGDECETPGARFVSDFMASVIAAALSMPANQLFNFFVTSPEAGRGGFSPLLKASQKFLTDQYFKRDSNGRLRVSKLALRDAGMRCAYVAPILSTFVAIERLFIRIMVDEQD